MEAAYRPETSATYGPDIQERCVISGSCREVDENCALLGCCAAYNRNALPTFRDNLSVPSSGVKMGPIGSLQTLEKGPIGLPKPR